MNDKHVEQERKYSRMSPPSSTDTSLRTSLTHRVDPWQQGTARKREFRGGVQPALSQQGTQPSWLLMWLLC